MKCCGWNGPGNWTENIIIKNSTQNLYSCSCRNESRPGTDLKDVGLCLHMSADLPIYEMVHHTKICSYHFENHDCEFPSEANNHGKHCSNSKCEYIFVILSRSIILRLVVKSFQMCLRGSSFLWSLRHRVKLLCRAAAAWFCSLPHWEAPTVFFLFFLRRDFSPQCSFSLCCQSFHFGLWSAVIHLLCWHVGYHCFLSQYLEVIPQRQM